MSKHTPGPWFHHGPSGSEHTAGGFIKSSPERNSGPLICSIYGTDGQPHQANARLIAAAPDLLKALIDFLDDPMGDPEPCRKAIDKALGKSL